MSPGPSFLNWTFVLNQGMLVETHLVLSGMRPEGWRRWEQKHSWSYKCQEANRGPLQKNNVGSIKALSTFFYFYFLYFLTNPQFLVAHIQTSVRCSLSLLVPSNLVHRLRCDFIKDGCFRDSIFSTAWLHLDFYSELILAILGINPHTAICTVSCITLIWTVDLSI